MKRRWMIALAWVVCICFLLLLAFGALSPMIFSAGRKRTIAVYSDFKLELAGEVYIDATIDLKSTKSAGSMALFYGSKPLGRLDRISESDIDPYSDREHKSADEFNGAPTTVLWVGRSFFEFQNGNLLSLHIHDKRWSLEEVNTKCRLYVPQRRDKLEACFGKPVEWKTWRDNAP